MQYQKAQDQFDRYQTADWGTFCRYLEIAEDLYASRHVDVYSNGKCLRYDRDHWVDEFGMLADLRNTPKTVSLQQEKWTIEQISEAEFEAIWESSETAPNQPQKYDASGFAQVPETLGSEMTPERLQRLPPWIAALFKSNT